MKTMKLYRVKLRGFFQFYDKPGAAMVVATDPTTAYEIVRKWLDEKNYGLRKDRALDCVELVAEDYEFTDAQASTESVPVCGHTWHESSVKYDRDSRTSFYCLQRLR